MQGLAINVAANADDPGQRSPVFADGSFRYVPIEETVSEAVDEPTYEQLGLSEYVPADKRQAVAHFDPEFPAYDFGQDYTYGDRHATKVSRIEQLSAGDVLFFYGTFDYQGDGPPTVDWLPTDWAACLFGLFTLERAPITGDEYPDLPDETKRHLRNNAHVRRDPFDAEVLVLGDPDRSQLLDQVIPLGDGIDTNRIVTELSSDSGKGPWYRRPMWFDEDATNELIDVTLTETVDRLINTT